MKKLQLVIIILLSAPVLFAQWTPVNNGLSGSKPTSMFVYLDTVMLGTAGSGIFKTLDHGNNWIDISGNIGNKNINDIKGGGGSKVIWAATEGGIFFTQDQANYVNNSSTGLTSADANYYWFGTEGDAEWAVGTNGSGLFTSPDLDGPWNNASAGLSGNGLIVNDLSGYDGDEENYAVIATDDGVYFADSTLTPWTQKNNGLSGNALLVKKVAALGSYVWIATQGGLFNSTDFGDNWSSLIPNEKFNTVSIVQTKLAPYGMAVFAFGTNGYISLDFANYSSIDMTGISGEITCFALTSTDLFIGVDLGNGSGEVHKRALDQIVSIENNSSPIPQKYRLEQNYPNPFNPKTVISYQVGLNGYSPVHVELSIYNALGQKVATLVSGRQPAGIYHVEWDSTGFASGVYFYQLQASALFGAAGIFSQVRKMILVR